MSQQPHEFELKVALTPDELDRLVANPKLIGAGRKPLKRTLLSVYYDAPDHRLHDKGLTLRVRADGEGFVQTVKTASGVSWASNPAEIEDQIVGSEPDVSCNNNKHIRQRDRGVSG